jgi:2-(1,2-epoxy-1,2-dihydrophenyl)acetyl-CoA isomerase
MNEARVRLLTEGNVSRITLTRSDRRNAIDHALVRELTAAVLAVPSDSRVVLFDADGHDFSVGGDLRDFPEDQSEMAAYTQRSLEIGNAMMTSLWDLPVPLITSARGAVAGGAIGWLLVGDVVLVSDTCRLTPAFPSIGLSPDCGVSWLVARSAPTAVAADLLLGNRTISSEEAVHWGLASRLIPDAELDQQALDLATKMATFDPGSAQATKRLLRSAKSSTFPQQLSAERAEIRSVVLGWDQPHPV